MVEMGWLDRIRWSTESPEDPVELRIQKRMLVTVSGVVAVIGVIWGVMYSIFDEPTAALIPFAYSASVTVSLVVYALTGRYRGFRFVQLLLILTLPFLLQLALGGFVGGSAVITWALLAPIGALTMSGRRQAMFWFGAYIALVLAAQAIQPSLDVSNGLPGNVIKAFFVLNIIAPIRCRRSGVRPHRGRLLRPEPPGQREGPRLRRARPGAGEVGAAVAQRAPQRGG